MCQIAAIVFVILLAGALGGWRNYLSEKTGGAPVFLRRFIESLVAAGATPLFLSVVGNDAIRTILENPPLSPKGLQSLLLLFGFSALASLFSTRFLDGLSEKVLKLEKQIEVEKEISEATQRRVESNARRLDQIDVLVLEDDGAARPSPADDLKKVREALSPEMRQILAAFNSSTIPARSIEGLAISTGLEIEKIKSVLDALTARGLLQRIDTARGTRWSLTPLSRQLGD
jgi:hypothetical protein